MKNPENLTITQSVITSSSPFQINCDDGVGDQYEKRLCFQLSLVSREIDMIQVTAKDAAPALAL